MSEQVPGDGRTAERVKQDFLNLLSTEIARRALTPPPVPSPNFDPRTATPDQLKHFGFPPKPDRKANPKVFEFWMKLFSPPLNFIPVDPNFPISPTGSVLDNYSSLSPLPTFPNRYEDSSNWSGGYIVPQDGRMFTEIHGSWQIPSSKIPAGADPSIKVQNYRSSVWIGLDGQRLYLNSSLPQIGTVQYIDDSSGQNIPKAGAWFQWWEREPRCVRMPVPLKKLSVEPGDIIFCSLIVVTDHQVQFIIKNQTTGDLLLPFTINAPTANLYKPPSITPTLRQLKVSGATAEWVLERPSRVKIHPLPNGGACASKGPLYELPDYGTEVLDNCLAVAALHPGAPATTQLLDTARLIDMFKVEKNPNRTAYISKAKPEGDQTIATFFV